MVDRDKVIEGFELFIKGFELFIKETPSVCTGEGAELDMFRNVLELLKEQEAVKPKSKVRHGANSQIQHFCGYCNTMLHGKPKFCSECGKGVLW